MSYAYFTDVDGKTMIINRESVTAVRDGFASQGIGPEILTLIDTLDGSVHVVRHSMDEVFERLTPTKRPELPCASCGYIPVGDHAWGR